MRIVLKTVDAPKEIVEEVASSIDLLGLHRLRNGHDEVRPGFAVVNSENESHITVHFEHADSWQEVVEECINILQQYNVIMLLISDKLETYFDIGIDHSEIGQSFYSELMMPRKLIDILHKTSIEFGITLYQDSLSS